MIKILEPDLRGNELKYITKCMREGWISSQGAFVKSLEKSALMGEKSRSCLAVANGTVAIHLALTALGIQKGDEIIVPNMTFGATINAILYTKAKPVLIDVCNKTWNISLKQIVNAVTPKTKAVLPVALFGNPSGIKEISKWASENGIICVIDAAEAVGATIKNKDIGSYGDAVTYSYFGNKTLTTGEGGAVIFKDTLIADKAKVLRDHGMSPKRRYHHEVIGFNYRMTNLQAAVGVAQYERINDILHKRKKVISSYKKLLISSEISFQDFSKDCISSNWVFAIRVKKTLRIQIEKMLEKNQIEFRRAFELMSEQPAFKDKCRIFTKTLVASNLYNELLLLPTHSFLTNNDIKHVCNVVNGVISK